MNESEQTIVPFSNRVNLFKYDTKRFFDKINKTQTGCWLWIGTKDDKEGYGRECVQCHSIRAHRLSWIIHNGQIPIGLHVLHDCPGGDNPACVNPAHLWLGTHQDNVSDRDAKGRTPKGSVHFKAKLDESKVLEILKLREKGEFYYVIAQKYGVSVMTVFDMFRSRTWKHVPRLTHWKATGGHAGGDKLNLDKAKQIRNMKGVFTSKELSKKFGVSSNLISKVWRGEIWIDLRTPVSPP